MRTSLVVGALACVVLFSTRSSAAAPIPPDAAPRPFLVGVDDDHAKWLGRPDGLITKYRDLGLEAVRVTIPWRRGLTKPNLLVGTYLSRAAGMVARGQRVVLAVFGKPSEAPVDGQGRAQYCDFLHHVLVRVPFRDVVIWNEANSPRFWPQSAGPSAYEALLATCWSTLHALRGPRVNVISTTAAHHDPAGFIRAVGDAYRASGRRHPILDTFGHNPYPDSASEPPWVQHPDPATVGEGDLPRLLDAIRVGFAGTAQPLPGMGKTTVWYLEDGFQTTVPRTKRRFYRGAETDPFVVPPLAPEGAEPWVRDQARQLTDALLLARCQPEVGAYFNFELLDDGPLAGWQSGVLWRDGTEKPSYEAFKAAVAVVTAGAVDCSTVTGAGAPIPSPRPTDPAAPPT